MPDLGDSAVRLPENSVAEIQDTVANQVQQWILIDEIPSLIGHEGVV